MIRSFHGITGVITGGGGGLGLAIAHELSRRGGRPALVDVRPEVVGVAATIPGATGHVADVADPKAWARVRDEVLATHGGVALLVSNAGVSVAGRFEEVPLADLEWLFGVNFWGAVHGARTFLPLLRKAPEGHLVHVSSSFAWLGFPGKSAYASSKAALKALSESLRAELSGTSVGVTTLFPGPVKTDIVRRGRAVSASQRDAEAAFLDRRALDPAHVARRCLDGVRRDHARVVVGIDYAMLDLAVRVAPSLALAAVTRASKRMPF